MRNALLSTIAFAAAPILLAPVQAQQFPLWLSMQGQYFNIPACAAPAKLTEVRDANGRIAWRCVAPKANDKIVKN